MPKLKETKPPKKLTDKQKIRLLEQDIKEMQRDFKETFAVLEEKKPEKKNGRVFLIAAVVLAVLILTALIIYFNIR